ncbi:YdbL family protein [Phenylobacterium sp.]|uniref:YdbL family protein n=1 Tax=Phenylobacterium sp. TaxID=1871053 RepID=UPI00286CC2C8|nr:YdbL family protein [Phenylobacterium sp.]
MTLNQWLAPVAVAVGTITFAGGAFADIAASKAIVDSAKSAGVVGEQNDGFLGFVKGGDASTKAAVAEINAGRRQVYAQAAAKNGVTVEAAGVSAFKAVVQGLLKPGEYYQNAAGAWTQK